MGKMEPEKITALEQVVEYSAKLIPAVKHMSLELREGRQDDTKELLKLIISGINWEIEVFNCLEDVINGNADWVDKEIVTEAVGNLGKGLKESNDSIIASCLEDDFLPFLKSFEKAATFRLEQQSKLAEEENKAAEENVDSVEEELEANLETEIDNNTI